MARTIFAYHAIADGHDFGATTVSPGQFRRQCRALAEAGWRAVRLDEAALGVDDGTFVVTFDDAYEGVASTVLPEFERLGWHATVFPLAGFTGREATWDVGAARKHRHLDWGAVRELASAGWEVGSHGTHHAALTDIDENAAFDELVRSRMAIEDAVGEHVTSLAYPFGATSRRIARLAQEAGYRRAVTMSPRSVPASPRHMTLPRWPVYRVDRGPGLVARLDGPGWLRELERAKVWTIQQYARGTRVMMAGSAAISDGAHDVE